MMMTVRMIPPVDSHLDLEAVALSLDLEEILVLLGWARQTSFEIKL
jgi:hypothetical protein